MQVALAGNYRTLLIELMIVRKEDTVLIIQDSEKNHIEDVLVEHGYKCFCYHRKKSKNELVNLLSYYKQNILLEQFLKDLKKEGNDFSKVIGCDHICALFKHFVDCNDITVIEEGFSNYTKKEELYREYGIGTAKFKLFRWIMLQRKLINYEPYGYDSKVKEIWLTGIQTVPVELAKKVKLIDLQALWSNADYEEINTIFQFTPSIFQGRTILLTQPLSEDGVCSEDRKIEIYEKIIEECKTQVVIKPHPRELTDYAVVFKNVLIDNNSYPFELLMLNKVALQEVVTITSTVAFECKEICNVHIYGTSRFTDLQEKLGVHQEQIVKVG
ncbi:MAG: glycosyltransferase family 52 [Clostridiales bacterium]|nr:glycosyltransferase family 52 protein [Roseburia sp.]MDD7636308.1 glycosyltransferase family 52 [Clostridiales bacterium]MDY4112620.1 glycosyltransferase family 52 [Roseburia sp.]